MPVWTMRTGDSVTVVVVVNPKGRRLTAKGLELAGTHGTLLADGSPVTVTAWRTRRCAADLAECPARPHRSSPTASDDPPRTRGRVSCQRRHTFPRPATGARPRPFLLRRIVSGGIDLYALPARHLRQATFP